MDQNDPGTTRPVSPADEPAPRLRVLVVDDEPSVLDALRNLFRRRRHHWDTVFAPGGAEALAAFETSPFDVVVSDMRMPRMDGPTLLQKVKDGYPNTARIVLSGHADREAIERALPVAHQFLSKPCDVLALMEVIERTSRLTKLLGDDSIRRILNKVDRLPSAPMVYWELTRAMARPTTSIADLAQIVQRDPAMSVKVLQLANSAFFGRAQRSSSIQQAVSYLGIELLRALSLAAHVFSTLAEHSVPGVSLDQIQDSSLRAARLCKRFVEDPVRGDEAFTAALLHDIGKVIMATALPEPFGKVARLAAETGQPLHVVERSELGVTHAEVGAYLMGIWGLPFGIVEAIAYHHDLRASPPAAQPVLAALHVADAWVEAHDALAEERAAELDEAFLEQAGCLQLVPRWLALASREGRIG